MNPFTAAQGARTLEAKAANLAKLARDIAMDILPLEVILKVNDIDNATWERIQKEPRFQSMLEDLLRSWNSAENTKERVKIKAQTAVEVALESFATDVMNESLPLAARLDVLKQLSRLGELEGLRDQFGRLAGGGGSGGGTSITINIKGVEKPITIDATPVAAIPAAVE